MGRDINPEIINSVIFDLDGTLVHTTPEYRHSLVGEILGGFEKTASKENIDKFWFESERDKVIIKDFDLEPELFWRKFREYDVLESRAKFTKPYDDVGFIKELRKNNYKTGIVTGAPVHIASLEIGMLGQENFDAIVIANPSNTEKDIKIKPHPHGLQECLSLLDIKKENAIYVGNAEEDVITARNAEVFDVLIDREEYDFGDINPSLRINSLYELRDFLGMEK